MPAADITFLHGEYVPACTHRVDKHFDDYCTLQLATGGAVDLWVGPTKFALACPPQHVWSAYPGPRVRFHPARDGGAWVHRFIAFRGPLVKRWADEALFPVPPQPAGDVPGLPERFDGVLELSRRSDPRAALRAANVLESILLDLADRAHRPAADPLVTAARRRLDALVDAPTAPDYDALAAALGVSESTLRRKFTRATGMAPHAYILQLRIARARRLLGETDLPIKAVADRLGYRDVYFFSRQFRQLTGVPPAAYRRSRLG
jgi:AraC-like DNA-binding protein